MTADKKAESGAPKLEEVSEDDLDQVQGGFKVEIEGVTSTSGFKVNLPGSTDVSTTGIKVNTDTTRWKI